MSGLTGYEIEKTNLEFTISLCRKLLGQKLGGLKLATAVPLCDFNVIELDCCNTEFKLPTGTSIFVGYIRAE